MKRIWLDIKLFFISLFGGMRSADDLLTTSNKQLDAAGAAEEQKVESNNIYAQLLRGEVTQEVKDIRYEMYEAARRADEYEVAGYSGKAVKKNKMLMKAPKNIYTGDGLKVVLVQDNKIAMDGVWSKESNSNALKTRVEADAEHTFKATHEYMVRHKVEVFTRKLVVKATGEPNKYKLDLYLSEYPIENDPRAVYVTKELESLYKSGSRTSDLTDLKTITFKTDRAYGDSDWRIYDFTVSSYAGMVKFNGYYILSFYASLPEEGIFDVTEEFNDEESKRKFEAKEKRPYNKGMSLLEYIAIQEFKKEKEIDETKANDLLKKVKNKKKEEE